VPAPDPQTVTSSDRLWSDEVGIARAGEIDKPPNVYEWSNGRAMPDPSVPYAPTQGPGKGTDENP
jgi:hypothetical protein